jgi:hypothetical protein
VGTVTIRELVVMFPFDTVPFGDIKGGATTRYMNVPLGVYRYAALRHSWNGRLIVQPVVDWLGEMPLPIGSFTYQVRIEPYGDGGMVYVLDVLRDPSRAFISPTRPPLFAAEGPIRFDGVAA